MSKRTKNDSRKMRQKRGRKKVAGSNESPRLCGFISNKQVYAQVINDLEGKTVVTSSSLNPDLRDQVKKKNTSETAAVVGKSVAELAKKQGVTRVVFDKSGYKYGKRLSALADAARKAGLEF